MPISGGGPGISHEAYLKSLTYGTASVPTNGVTPVDVIDIIGAGVLVSHGFFVNDATDRYVSCRITIDGVPLMGLPDIFGWETGIHSHGCVTDMMSFNTSCKVEMKLSGVGVLANVYKATYGVE